VTHFVPESAIDYVAIIERGGANLGDEDFALFKCPTCGFVYLLEYEVDTVYLDGNDLAQRQDVTDPARGFVCISCQKQFPSGVWAGPRAEEKFLVTWGELQRSPWFWAARPSQVFDDPK
jgi:hypothetical protein